MLAAGQSSPTRREAAEQAENHVFRRSDLHTSNAAKRSFKCDMILAGLISLKRIAPDGLKHKAGILFAAYWATQEARPASYVLRPLKPRNSANRWGDFGQKSKKIMIFSM